MDVAPKGAEIEIYRTGVYKYFAPNGAKSGAVAPTVREGVSEPGAVTMGSYIQG